MGFLLLYFVILIVSTTTNTQSVFEHVVPYSTVRITVQYYMWVGTEVTQQYHINITLPQFTTFYGLMQLAEAQNPEDYR